jgi:hypothetical protein
MEAPWHRPAGGRFKRLLWFALIYVGSLGAFTVLVYGLRGLVPH